MKEKKKSNKILKIAIWTFVTLLIIFIAYVYNTFNGNAISKVIARHAGWQYVEERYPSEDLFVGRVGYDFKMNGYYVNIASKSEQDVYFDVYVDSFGHIQGDNYENVTSGWNTWIRLNGQYEDLVNTVFQEMKLESDICFGEIGILEKEANDYQEPIGVKLSALELNKDYDIKELGSQYGNLTVYVQDDIVTAQRAAEILSEIRKCFDENNVPFKTIHFVLQDKEKTFDNDICVQNFRYEDIMEEGLVERIIENHNELKAHYEKIDTMRPQEAHEE